MKIEEYKELANRTMADLGSEVMDFAHMALGLTSELGELFSAGENQDRANIIEEHGDLNWFLAGICKIFNFGFTEIINEGLNIKQDEEIPTEALTSVFEIADMSKALLAYGKPVDRAKLRCQLVRLATFLKAIPVEENFDYLHSLQKNIEKLQARFPDKFDADKAINRDTDNERKILES